MRLLLTSLVFSFLSLPAFANSLLYIGAKFDVQRYGTSTQNPIEFTNRGPLDLDRILLSLDFTTPLTANTTYTTYGDFTDLGGEARLLGLTGTPYDYGPLDLMLETGANAEIISWNGSVDRSGVIDRDFLRISTTGDSIQYENEYSRTDGCIENPFCTGSEALNYSSSEGGRWVDPSVVPLPAGFPLLLTAAIGLFGFSARRKS